MSQSAPEAEPEAGPDKLDRQIIVISSVVIVGAIMSILDTTIVNVALATLGRDLHASLSTIQGGVSARRRAGQRCRQTDPRGRPSSDRRAAGTRVHQHLLVGGRADGDRAASGARARVEGACPRGGSPAPGLAAR